MNTKKEYIAPQLTTVSIKVERGYAVSQLGMNTPLFEPESESYDDNHQEYWLWNNNDPSANQIGGGSWDW